MSTEKTRKDRLVQYIFSDTECWCHPSREGLFFESLHSEEILVASWDAVYRVVNRAHDYGLYSWFTPAQAFEALHEEALLECQTWSERTEEDQEQGLEEALAKVRRTLDHIGGRDRDRDRDDD